MHLVWIVPLVLLIAYLSSPRFRGDIAESRVRRILAAGLEKSRYTVINDLVIPSGGGTIGIDHVVVSKFGVFVIESQHAWGWVSGGEFQDRWKQSRFRRFTRFDNPLHRNTVQAEAVARLLAMPASRVHRFVVLVGHKGFKGTAPANLLSTGQVIPAMRRKSQQLLDEEQAGSALRTLRGAHVDARRGLARFRWLLLQIALVLVLLGGIFAAYHEELTGWWTEVRTRSEQAESPDRFHPDGSPKSEQELWEDSLVCAYSADTGRCSCYEPDGKKVQLDSGKCRSLAERGSILRQ